MTKRFDRREFIKTASTSAAALAVGLGCSQKSSSPTQSEPTPGGQVGSGQANKIISAGSNAVPKRVLGKSGMEVSLLAFGGGSQFMANKNGIWEKSLEDALDRGINYFDTCEDYGNDSMMSETRFGEILSPIRDQVYITTKFNAKKNNKRDVSRMMTELETSLKRLKTDYLDVYMIHALDDNDSVTDVSGGVYKKMLELKDEGVIKNIGFSSMSSANAAKKFLKNLDFDVCMLAINPTTYGNYEELAVPEAIKKNTGIMAMKVMRDVVGKKATSEELMEWALDRDGVAGAVIGHVGREVLQENADLVMKYQPSSVKHRWTSLEKRLNGYGSPTTLCWAHPDYYDGMLRG